MISGREVGSVLAAAQVRGVSGSAEARRGTPVRGPAQAAPSDAVTVAAGAHAMTHWLQQLHQLPEVRAERVEAARQRLHPGQQPSPHEVARQMLRRVAGDRHAGRL